MLQASLVHCNARCPPLCPPLCPSCSPGDTAGFGSLPRSYQRPGGRVHQYALGSLRWRWSEHLPAAAWPNQIRCAICCQLCERLTPGEGEIRLISWNSSILRCMESSQSFHPSTSSFPTSPLVRSEAMSLARWSIHELNSGHGGGCISTITVHSPEIPLASSTQDFQIL